MAAAMLFAAVTFCSTLAGGAAALRWPGRTELLMALAGGLVLGAALFELLPEAVEHAEEAGMAGIVPWLALLAGYLVFRLAERRLHDHDHDHCGHDEAAPGRIGVAGAAGFTIHSFFDGLAIGLGFQVDAGVGVLIALAVIGHDFSDGLLTVSYLVAHRHPLQRQRRWLLAVASAPVLGALAGSVVPLPDEVFPLVLGFFAGVFLFAASAHLLPRAAALPLARMVPAVVIGLSVMFAVSRVGH